jgi:hypothetical protein
VGFSGKGMDTASCKICHFEFSGGTITSMLADFRRFGSGEIWSGAGCGGQLGNRVRTRRDGSP